MQQPVGPTQRLLHVADRERGIVTARKVDLMGGNATLVPAANLRPAARQHTRWRWSNCPYVAELLPVRHRHWDTTRGRVRTRAPVPPRVSHVTIRSPWWKVSPAPTFFISDSGCVYGEHKHQRQAARHRLTLPVVTSRLSGRPSPMAHGFVVPGALRSILAGSITTASSSNPVGHNRAEPAYNTALECPRPPRTVTRSRLPNHPVSVRFATVPIRRDSARPEEKST